MIIRSSPSFDYSDVFIIPNFSNIATRKEVSTHTTIGDLVIDVPVVSANMDTITELEMAVAMCKSGGIGAIHRFMSIQENVSMFQQFVKRTNGSKAVFVSVGLLPKDSNLTNLNEEEPEFKRAVALYDAGARYFIIDTAHGHCDRMLQTIKILKYKFPNIFVVAGNVTTFQAAVDLYNWGANAVKVGIGGGKVCLTKNVTGVTMPMFSAIAECAGVDKNLKIIADGGIREYGDIAKALGAGASLVMSGYLFAGTTEAASQKEYRGMASIGAMAKIRSLDSAPTPEGKTISVETKGSVENIMKDIKGGLQSSFAYTGSRNLSEFQNSVEFGYRISNKEKECL